jgi:hypothetical protein
VSDRLALAHAIEGAGIERGKAEGMATAIVRLVEGSVATKADLERAEAALKADVAAVKADVARLEAALKADMVRIEAALRAEIARVADRTFTRLGALVAVVAGILFAALHRWPPHGG